MPLVAGAVMALAALPATTAPALADPEVVGIRVGAQQGLTRVVVTVTEAIKYRVSVLSDPYRLIIDLPVVEWRVPSQSALSNAGPVTAYRFGSFSAEATRVVIDLSRPVRIDKVFHLAPKDNIRTWRVVVDLADISAEEFDRILRDQSKRQPTPDDRSPPKAEKPRGAKPVIVLDPGHGGVDPGSTGASGAKEKDIVLQMGRELQAALNKTGRYKVVLTREGDTYVPLRGRYEIARRSAAELFLSLHADSNNNPIYRGTSVYTLSERASDQEADALAKRENRSDVIAGVDLSGESDQVAGILIDLAQRETLNQSIRLADVLVGEMRRETAMVPKPHRSAGFAVLKAPDVPSVLIEFGHISNPKDEKLLQTPAYRAKTLAAVVRSVNKYFDYMAKLENSPRARHN
ncbi:MAG: N-acetylmuramoyl-L-alanine amidase [Alphaproteobacteria bacterium]